MNVAVGEIAEQVRGVSYAKDDAKSAPSPGYFPILRANNITENGLTFEHLVYVPEKRISRKQILQCGDVVIAASSGSIDVVGKAADLREKFEGGFGAFCKVLRPNSSVVNHRYFSHFFRTASYRKTISALAAGANINNLKNEHLDELRIPLPPLDEQQRIAAILDKADALIRNRKCALGFVDELNASLVKRHLQAERMVELGDIISDGPTNGLYKPSTDYGDGVPILRINNFYDGRVVNMEGLKRLRVSDAEKERFQIGVGDIIVNRVNSLEYLGKSTIIEALAEPTVFESNMMRFSLDSAAMLPEVCIALLQTSAIKQQILGMAKNAVNQSSINQRDVRSLSLPLPKMSDQKAFISSIRASRALEKTFVGGLHRLNALFSSLQSRAFSGQL